MESRGVSIGEKELQFINNYIYEQKNEDLQEIKGMRRFITDDPNAPRFYSMPAVYAFTLFCGALFGSILLAINLGKLKKNLSIIWVLLFGVLYTMVQIIITNYYDLGNSFVIACGLGSAYIIGLFWERFIGNTYYQARQIWIPLIIALLIGVVFISSIF